MHAGADPRQRLQNARMAVRKPRGAGVGEGSLPGGRRELYPDTPRPLPGRDDGVAVVSEPRQRRRRDSRVRPLRDLRLAGPPGRGLDDDDDGHRGPRVADDRDDAAHSPNHRGLPVVRLTPGRWLVAVADEVKVAHRGDGAAPFEAEDGAVHAWVGADGHEVGPHSSPSASSSSSSSAGTATKGPHRLQSGSPQGP
ncbi:MAG: hypothetical protein EBU90_31210, partial [Proteobacteria bacterium]|nr:hypothetical protein [Pseudomonadota bacterium]